MFRIRGHCIRYKHTVVVDRNVQNVSYKIREMSDFEVQFSRLQKLVYVELSRNMLNSRSVYL